MTDWAWREVAGGGIRGETLLEDDGTAEDVRGQWSLSAFRHTPPSHPMSFLDPGQLDLV